MSAGQRGCAGGAWGGAEVREPAAPEHWSNGLAFPWHLKSYPGSSPGKLEPGAIQGEGSPALAGAVAGTLSSLTVHGPAPTALAARSRKLSRGEGPEVPLSAD